MKPKAEQMFALAARIQAKVPGFYLAGGTAVMFRYAHRESYDLDFFSDKEFSFRAMRVKIRRSFRVENETEGADNLDLWICGSGGSRSRSYSFPFRMSAAPNDFAVFGLPPITTSF